MAGSRPPGEKRRDEDTLNASRRSDVSKYDPFSEPPSNERQAAWNKIAEAVEAYSVSTDASTLASLLREEAIVHFYMAEALERITDDPHQKSKAIGIKRSKAAQVEPFPQRAVISEANYEQIRELVETGRRESVWEAFHTNPSLASDLIAEDAKIDQTLRQAADSTLTFLLQAQARGQLSMALALARIAEQPQQKSRAIEILLDEAAQLTDRETICPALRSLKSFEPLAVIPSLIAFLGKARDGPVRDAAFETFEHLILHGFAAYDSDPAAARRGRDLTLRFFVAILGATALDEPERVMVAGIVLRCAEILGSGLDAVIGRMAQLSNVTVEEMGLRICGRVLASPDSHAAERAEAAGWVLRHLSGEHAGIPICAFASQSSAAPTGEGSVESPRVPIHPSLTDTPSPEQTSPVCMDTSQEVSPGPTAAPSLNLDLSSHQFTTNGEGNGFFPARSDAIPTGVHTDQLDLSSVSFSFTTEDPTVLRTRMLLVSEPDNNERPDAVGTRRRSHRGSDGSSQRGGSAELGGEVLPSKTAETQRVIGVPKPSVAEDVWAPIHDIDAELALARATILPKLESLLAMLAEIGTLGTFEANDKAVKKLDEYLGICKQQLTYTDAERNLRDVPVTVDCLHLADYKAGAIRVYRGNHGKAITQKSRFPSFGLMPIEESFTE